MHTITICTLRCVTQMTSVAQCMLSYRHAHHSRFFDLQMKAACPSILFQETNDEYKRSNGLLLYCIDMPISTSSLLSCCTHCVCFVAGAWQLKDGPDLQWTEGDNWRATVELPGGTVYEYKYVLLDSYSGHALSWQRGNNSVLAIKTGEDSVEASPQH